MEAPVMADRAVGALPHAELWAMEASWSTECRPLNYGRQGCRLLWI